MQNPASEAVSTALPDAEIVRRLRGGNREAFTVLMRRYNQSLYRAARSILKDDSEAEDAVQEGYLLAYRSLGTYRGDANLATWLTRIVINEALGRLRKRQRRAEVIQLGGDTLRRDERPDDDTGGSMDGFPEQQAMRAEARRLLETKIDELPDAFRTVFVLRALQEMSVEETAACLDIPAATVRTRLFRAKGLLREALAREMDFALEDAFAFAGERCDRIVSTVLAHFDDLPNRDADPAS